MGWLKQLKHNLRDGVQCILTTLDSDSEDSSILDSSDKNAVSPKLTSDVTESCTEETEIEQQLMDNSDISVLIQEGKLVSYGELSSPQEWNADSYVPVVNEDGL
ncbi:hypothetical protein VKT23_009222 [Stygiomarasmius scandens]|uniref:Uncharacterized protein n=1 Tax=Marasmiellus scandens TaxID=2682957 RepID=A0ABR1JI43_9AGAR